MEQKTTSHKVLGEYMYGDMKMCRIFPKYILDKVLDFDLTDDDILVCSYPKAGTMWTSEVTWLVHSNGDFPGAQERKTSERVKFLEVHYTECPEPSMDLITQQEHPHFIHSHLPSPFYEKNLKKGLKVIVVIRNPKDLLVSFYHFYRSNKDLGNFKGTWNEFFEMYKNQELVYGDYFEWYESWIPHLNKPNVLLMKFEDMKSDLHGSIKKISDFLKKPLAPSLIGEIASFTTFENMQANPMASNVNAAFLDNKISPFMRKGIIGDWKNYFTEEQSEYIDEKYRIFSGKFGIVLRFE